MKTKISKTNDLRNGMIVELKNKFRGMVTGDRIFFESGFLWLYCYNDYFEYDYDEDFNIIKVFDTASGIEDIKKEDNCLDIIYDGSNITSKVHLFGEYEMGPYGDTYIPNKEGGFIVSFYDPYNDNTMDLSLENVKALRDALSEVIALNEQGD